MIEARGIHKSYGHRRVLTGADLDLGPGSLTVLEGDNGSGKSTLLHILVGLRRPDQGSVHWRGIDLQRAGMRRWRRERAAWGFLPQHPGLPEAAASAAVLRWYAALRGIAGATAMEWLDRVGLGAEAATPVAELSGGMRQRLGIALALCGDPRLVLMDEPSGNLDPGWRRQLHGWLIAAAEGGAAVLVCSQLEEGWPVPVRHLRCIDGRVETAA